jgi:ribosome-associated protein
MIRITPSISIALSELEESFVRSSGPGGQNVNKVSTAVELRFDVRASPNLTEPVRARLEKLAGSRLTKTGVLIIFADRFRTQDANRSDARARLVALIKQATIAPKFRVKTKPTKASKERRIEGKKQRSGVKKMRQSKSGED